MKTNYAFGFFISQLTRINRTLIVLGLVFGVVGNGWGQVLWSSSGGSAWLTGSNWTGGAVPTSTQIAQFGVNPTSATVGVGINMNGSTNNGTNNQAIGGLEVTSNRSANFLVGNSSTTSNGTLTLNGTTINSITNTILRNNSSSTFTLQDVQGSGNKLMAIVIANSTENVVNVDGAGNIVISSNISGSSKILTLNANSTGDLRLSGSNTYSGGTNVKGGSGGGRLRVDAVASLPTTGTVAVSTGGRITLNVAGTFGGTTQSLTFNPTQTVNPALDILSGAAVTWQGTVAINANTRIEANGAAGSLTFSG
ncbi:MAG: hypothetical protein K2Q22_01680, partial [Cytophagales bacterium]|nr:hypothetical protein [Cytophagales bacterium]